MLIDLIGYRRFGHNEADEPAYTQPEMYATIKGKKRVSELWADELIRRTVITPPDVEREKQDAWDELTSRHQALQEQIAELRESGVAEHQTGEYQLDRTASPEVDTTVSAELLRDINDNLLRVPEGFTVHPKLVRQLERRREALDAEIDWAHAEALAYGSLLAEGTPIRLTGQDTERGTFSQRHLVLHDATNGQTSARSSSCRPRARRSSCTTARCRRSAAWASSTATARSRPRRSCSGRRSSATSSTARR